MKHGRNAVLPLLFLAAATPLNAQQDRIVVRGVVVDETTGEPLIGAYVRVRGHRIDGATNVTGGFVLRGVPRGAIIEVTQLGYASWLEQVDSAATLRIELPVNPLVMDALEVVTDRLADRWRSSAVATRRYTSAQIMAAPVANARDFAYLRASFGTCPDGRADCVWRRGEWHAPTIYIDEVPYCSDLNALLGIPTHEIHVFEVVGGSTIHVYTKQFAERLALGQVRLMPRLLISSLTC